MSDSFNLASFAPVTRNKSGLNTESHNWKISITDIAKEKLRALNVGESHFLRISIKAGGCSGQTYDAIIDDVKTGFDVLLYDDNAGIQVWADRESIDYLDGLIIDYSNDLIQSGFRFKNRKALKSCACGSSFAV
jgi:iron-sulfur cluster assembly protein